MEWSAFWTELAAGIITFGLGVIFAFILLRHEFREAAKRDFRQFQALAREVREDFLFVQTALNAWAQQLPASKGIGPIDTRPLAWEIDESLIRFTFAQYGVQRRTHVAANWV